MTYALACKPGRKVKLAAIDAGSTSGLDETLATAQLAVLDEEIGALQDLLYAARQNAVLIVLQGMDTSGKDGTIRRVTASINPQGCHVQSFKVPNEVERAHDFLWRAHRVTPGKGAIAIFNRSYYEDVLVARVHGLVPRAVWQQRYQQINDFERMLTENGTIILKFFLHISRAEQEARLLARERNAKKAWKLSAADWAERKHWRDYRLAYEAALAECSTSCAPWHVVPADKKWYRNLAVADAIVRALHPYKKGWLHSLERIGEQTLAELRQTRAATK